jgi:hypothetical protein
MRLARALKVDMFSIHQKIGRAMMLERGVHSNWAKNAWALENGRESGYD